MEFDVYKGFKYLYDVNKKFISKNIPEKNIQCLFCSTSMGIGGSVTVGRFDATKKVFISHHNGAEYTVYNVTCYFELKIKFSINL